MGIHFASRFLLLVACLWAGEHFLDSPFTGAFVFLSSLSTNKRWLALALSEFFVGAIIWILGAIFMLRGDPGWSRLLWTVGWGIGIAMIYGSLTTFSQDFYAVAKIADQPIDDREMTVSNDYLSGRASLASSGVMLLVLTIWMFVIPAEMPHEHLARLGAGVLQLPILFMLIAFIYVLKQPLDKRNREKLMLYLDSRVESPRVRENLRDLLVKRHRVRYGVKICTALLRPFFRLKTKGTNNLQRDKYPSVFVCNHGFIDGPIASVIYLPTYFRPWIHDEMLDVEKAYENIAFSFSWVFRVFGKRLGRGFVMTAAKITCWALRSFNPIPVTRGASQEVFVTMEKSLDALEEGDNIMLFPEKPGDRTIDGAESGTKTEDLRSFYTGFAHIGKMYYDKTGRSLLFYPVYSNRKRHVFNIGAPVQYDPSLPPRESKRHVAEQLQRAIEELAE